MIETITLNPAAPPVSMLEQVDASPMASNNLDLLPRVAPAFIRADEAYFWSFFWQRDVRESMEALAAGDYEDFDSDDPNEVTRWLFRVDHER